MAELYPLIEEMLEFNGEVVFTVSGVSMQPMVYNRRDSVKLVKATLPLKKFDIPFYKMDDGAFIMHRVIKVHKDGTYTCRGDNCWEPETPIRNDQIIGIVKEFYRNGKKYNVDKSLGYWLYTRTWPLLHYLKKYYKYLRSFKASLKLFLKHLRDIIAPEKVDVVRKDGSVETIIYRQAYSSDLPEIQDIFLRHADHEIKEYNNDIINRSWAHSKSGKKYLSGIVENHFFYLALCNKKVIGYIRGQINEFDSDNFSIGHCKGVYVDAEYRGLGIGTKLIGYFKDYCKEKGCNRLKIEFLEENVSAQRLYERNGFKPHSRTLMCDIAE